MAKKRVAQEEGSYSWMDTYGDLVTLLLTFFVLLFAFSSVNEEKWNTLVEAFTGAPPMRSIASVDLLSLPNFAADLPQSYINIKSTSLGARDDDQDPGENGMIVLTPEQLEEMLEREIVLSEEQRLLMSTQEYQENEAQFSLLYERLVIYIKENGLENMLFASRDMESIYLRVAAGVLFQSGRANIREDAMPVLDTLEDICFTAGDALSLVTVEGHTDTVPISNARFADNWELSSARASSVGHYLWGKGRIPQNKFSLSGYGEFRPIATNETEEGKQLNRRVEFVLRKKLISAADIEDRNEQGERAAMDISEDPNALTEQIGDNGAQTGTAPTT